MNYYFNLYNGDSARSYNFFNKFSISLVVYYLIHNYTSPRVSIFVLALLTMASIYNTSLWNLIKQKLSSTVKNDNVELLTILKQLSLYEKRTRSWNNSRKLNQRQLTWTQQNMLDKIGYNNKIEKLDQAIRTNQKLITEIIEYTKLSNNITYTDLLVPVESRDNYRVIESLCHFQRDWSTLGDVEIQPILHYIKSQTLKLDKPRTMVINPGSGLGRVAHELAIDGFGKVQSIEYSMLMKVLNEFIYSPNAKYPIYSFIHSYSNQVNTASQLRSFELETLGRKPSNLEISYGDFNKFDLNSSFNNDKDLKTNIDENFDNVVIVTVFFIDTLENLFQYLETIDSMSKNFKGRKTWINVGPLKYGTRPKVELNLKELMKLVKLMGWNIENQQDPTLLGYLTDLDSMWQGQYGVSMFTCTKD